MTLVNDHVALQLGILGFSGTEKRLMTGICKLSMVRAPKRKNHLNAGYHLVDPDSARTIHILVVDADNSDALKAWSEIRSRIDAAPVVLVSRQTLTRDAPDQYPLRRDRLGSMLLKQLDEIVERDFQDAARKTCLVVDDSQLIRTQMELILQEIGLGVEFAEDAETGLQLLRDRRIDIIFLDVMLPEMNGYKACKLIKTNPNTRDRPVVMLTSKRSPFNKMHGALVGCDCYLTKPVDAAKVHKVLEDYALLGGNPIGTPPAGMLGRAVS